MLQAKAEQQHTIPGTQRTRGAAETIRDWLHHYRQGGFDALYPKLRADRGQPRRLPPDVAELLVTIKSEHPAWSVRQVIQSAHDSGQLPDALRLPASTVHRLLSREGLMIKRTDQPLGVDRRRFTFKYAGKLWMSDVMHGPKVDAGRQRHKTYLIAFIDDATRVIPYAAFARGENTAAFLPVFLKCRIRHFKNHGTTWERSPHAVNDHDFRSQADGIAIPYGIYDLSANRGFVVVGTSHDTPDFAADNLLRWWQAEGLQHYPRARELLVLADSGGSNSPRIRCFKHALQTRLVDPHRLKVTVCHYPGGASKWNPIDHRLFSEISKNWAGVPLRDYETILNHIRTTTTDTGLSVVAQLVEQEYPTGVKIADPEFASIALQPHQTQPLRNYSICPRS